MDDNLSRELLDRLAEEFMERHRRGEHPEIAEYVALHTELADEIRELFPTIAALEGLKQQQDPSPVEQTRVRIETLRQLGEFSVIRELGRGGMGVVFEAVQETLDRHVALKVLPKQSLLNDDALARFQREARIAAHLQHPNIVPIYSIGEVEGHHFIAMQCIRGIGWDRLIKRLVDAQQGNSLYVSPSIVDECHLLRHLAARHLAAKMTSGFEQDGMDAEISPPLSKSANNRTGGTIKPDQNLYDRCLPPVSRPYDFGSKYYIEAGKMGLQVADALRYAHEQGIWHRDVKPANLILDTNGHVWITDFGLAKARESEDITRTGNIMGTLRFIAPENFDGHTDARSDIYSLGLTLYELLTLRPAFQGKSQSELIRRILYDTPPLPRSINPDIPGDLESIVLKAVARDPELRYKTTTAMARDFQRFLDGEPVTVHPVKLPHEAVPVRRSKSTAVRVISGLLLIIAVIAGVMLIRFQSEEENRPKPMPETTTVVAPAPEITDESAPKPEQLEASAPPAFSNEEEDEPERVLETQAVVDLASELSDEFVEGDTQLEVPTPPVRLQDRPEIQTETALLPPPQRPGMRPPPDFHDGESRPPVGPPVFLPGSPQEEPRPHPPPPPHGLRP